MMQVLYSYISINAKFWLVRWLGKDHNSRLVGVQNCCRQNYQKQDLWEDPQLVSSSICRSKKTCWLRANCPLTFLIGNSISHLSYAYPFLPSLMREICGGMKRTILFASWCQSFLNSQFFFCFFFLFPKFHSCSIRYFFNFCYVKSKTYDAFLAKNQNLTGFFKKFKKRFRTFTDSPISFICV